MYFWGSVCILGIVGGALEFSFLDTYIAPVAFDSRIERLHEKGLPKATVENGCVYFRMKADDFRLPLPAGYRAMTPVITSRGFDSVGGSIELRPENASHPFFASECAEYASHRLQTGGWATIEPIAGGMLIKFHYFGDR